jgi:hypothetical protein
MNQLAAWTTYLNLDAPGALYFTWSKVRGEIKQCIRRRPDENSVMELNAAEQKRGVNALASTTAACEVTYWYGSAAS